MTIRNRTIHTINYLYSILWIAVTGTDKHEYRERSRVHDKLVSLYNF